MKEVMRLFTGYAFRTSSRFGSHVEISVADGVKRLVFAARMDTPEMAAGFIEAPKERED